MKEQTCCFTGHRIVPLAERDRVSESLEKVIVDCIGEGYIYFCTGGALGFDTRAALAVLKLKKQFSQIKLNLVIPCENQTLNWKAADIEKYEYIKSQADNVVMTSIEYTKGCMHKRNRHMVDNSSLCICYLKKTSGGTAYTVEYARKSKIKIINIADIM